MAECDFSSTVLLIKFRSGSFCEEGKIKESEEKITFLAQVYVNKPATNKLKPPIIILFSMIEVSKVRSTCGTDMCLLFFN